MMNASRPLVVYLVVASALFAVPAWASSSFSLDPASPSIDGAITPDDVLMAGPGVSVPGWTLGLVEDFFRGVFDSLDALSSGQNALRNPLYFSVDRVAVGLPGTAVYSEAQPGLEEAAGDVFMSLPPSGGNTRFVDEADLGLIPGFFGDDLDALELGPSERTVVYFSIDSLSSTNGFGSLGLADDIFLSTGDGTHSPFADGVTDIGLEWGDDIDALVLLDRGEIGVLDPGQDAALFSLSSFSSSTFTFTGASYVPGLGGSLSPADILFTDFTGAYSLHAPAADLGLRADDELDALATIPPVIPAPASILLLTSGLAALVRFRKKVAG